MPKFELKNPPYIACAINDRDVLTLDRKALIATDIIELRIDMFEDIGQRHVKEIFNTAKDKFSKPIIATIRDVSEGGYRQIIDRLSLYETVLPFSDIVDIEINAEIFKNVKKLCEDSKTSLIGSYHNFDKTPDDDFLERVFKKAKDLGADIIKIAVMPECKEDMFRLIEFTLRHKKEQIITMAMGDLGLPTRILNPVIGSIITYGYINSPSAPGQLSIKEIDHIFRILKLRKP